jgi:CheY-like chemotaxis protein
MSDTPTILVIDDDKLLAGSIAERLKEEGYNIEVAENGTTGLSLALEHKPRLIILDYQLPDIDGLEVLKQLRADERGKKVEVIFATNTYDMSVVNAALSQDVHDYVLKADTSLDQIAELVRKYVHI